MKQNGETSGPDVSPFCNVLSAGRRGLSAGALPDDEVSSPNEEVSPERGASAPNDGR